jgi:hypothetical protein
MTSHVNTWPTRSRELAGRVALRSLPASAIVRSIAVDAFDASADTALSERQFEERKEARIISSGDFANYLPTLGLAGWHYTQGR